MIMTIVYAVFLVPAGGRNPCFWRWSVKVDFPLDPRGGRELDSMTFTLSNAGLREGPSEPGNTADS